MSTDTKFELAILVALVIALPFLAWMQISESAALEGEMIRTIETWQKSYAPTS